jgi:putative tryptophan/tyrosine transport system substrate-binding protein
MRPEVVPNGHADLLSDVRCWVNSGKHMLAWSFSGFDLRQWFLCRFQPLEKHSFEPLRCRLLSMGTDMQRREFITLAGGAAATWPIAARAQQRERMRRISVLMGLAADDTESQARLAAFAQGLQQSGWIVGQNVRVDYRWGAGNADTMRKYAAELVALAPDVILAHSSAAVAPLLQATRKVPIVFVLVADPVGFTSFEYSMGGKWLELLKEIAPYVTRTAVLRESAFAAGPGQFGAIAAVASSLGMEVLPIDVRDPSQIEHDVTTFAQKSNGGLIVTGSPAATVHRDLIFALAARHRLPAVYNSRLYVIDGGLLSYGPDFVDLFRRAAGYVDRILKGEKPADLPVQAPTKYELAINLKTAKMLGLTVPQGLLTRADEVIDSFLLHCMSPLL